MIKLNSDDQMPSMMPSLYDEKDIIRDTLDSFIADTRRKKKQPLVLFGSNWCPDAQYLDAILNLPSFKVFLDQNFVIMRIDVGRYTRNMPLMAVLGLPSQEGIPRVIILDLNSEPLNLESNDQWRSARQSNPQDIFDYVQTFKK